MPSGVTVNDLLERLEKQYPKLGPYRSIVLTSVNEDYVDREAVVGEGDEVAIFPPVSGGSSPESAVAERPREVYRLTREPIDARGFADMILRPADGAICIFEGVVRNNSKGKRTRYLEYEGYETMALKKMEEIGVFVRPPGTSTPSRSFTGSAVWRSARRASRSSLHPHIAAHRSMPANTPSTLEEDRSHLEEGIL